MILIFVVHYNWLAALLFKSAADFCWKRRQRYYESRSCGKQANRFVVVPTNDFMIWRRGAEKRF